MREPTCRELCSDASTGKYCACDGYPLQVWRRDNKQTVLAKLTPDPKIFKPAPVPAAPKPKSQHKTEKSVSSDRPDMPKKYDSRKSISISGATYEALKHRSEVMQVSMSRIVGDEINRHLDMLERQDKCTDE